MFSIRNYFDTKQMLPKMMDVPANSLPASKDMYKEYMRIAIPSVMEAVLISLINMMDTCNQMLHKKMMTSVISVVIL